MSERITPPRFFILFQSQSALENATLAEVKKRSVDVGILRCIPKEEDAQFPTEPAFADACCSGNPRDTNVEEIKEQHRSLM